MFSRRISFNRRFIAFCVIVIQLAVSPPVFADDASAADASVDFTPPPIEVPEGFTVELVAGPPLVKYPMMAAFDDRGRLFIAESDGQNLSKEGLLEQKPRFVRMIEDIDGDGTFDKSTIFADQMVMPEGALCHDGSFYIMSAPYLWKLDDTDGDGVVDRREQLVGEMDLIGNANQHGPYLTPAGRLLFSGGTFGYDLVGSDGSGPGKGNWASVFSCDINGGDVRVESHCGINPVEVVFTPEGEMLGTCAIFDRVGGRCDSLVHWVHGGTYAERLREPYLKQTGRFLPAAVRWGQVAPAGLVRMRGGQFGDEYKGNLFACFFNSHELIRIKLERIGATFRGEHEVFLSSPSSDFHPADILEDADGSLILVDTGAWLTMGCPTSKDLSHGNFGAIYRIRKTDVESSKDPASYRGLTIDWVNLSPYALAMIMADDSSPAITDRAVSMLVSRGNRSIPTLTKVIATANSSEYIELRRNAVWSLARIGTVPARSVLCAALHDEDPSVRQSAVHAVGVLRERAAVERLKTIVVNDELPIRREAATALGLIGDATAVPAIFDSLRTADDEFVEHALIYALIEIGDVSSIEPGLTVSDPRVQRGALIAMDQIAGESLTREAVAPLLATTNADLQHATLDVIAKHSTWGEEITDLLRQSLLAEELLPAHQAIIVGAVPAFFANVNVQSLVTDTLARPDVPAATLVVLLEAIGRIEQPQLPAAWIDSLGRLLSHPDEAVRRQLLASLRPFDASPFEAPLRATAADTTQPNALRIASLALVTHNGAELDDNELTLLTDALQSDTPPVERLTAANALSLAKLSTSQLQSLITIVREAGPLELSALLQSFANAARNDRFTKDEATELGFELVAALVASAGKDSLSPAGIQATFSRFPADVMAAAAKQFPATTVANEVQLTTLNAIESEIGAGNPELGQQVFFSNRIACAGCHKIAGKGGSVGPDLSQIAKVRTARQLAEAVLLPSATLANGFESYTIATVTGNLHTGLIRRESADAIYLVGTDGREVRVGRDEIDEVRRSETSIMPQGLDKQLTSEQLRDLVAYLSTLK